MPAYDMECVKCGTKVERQVSIVDRNGQTCHRDGCHGPLKIAFNPTPSHFKGDWETNDHKKGKPE